MSKISLGKFKEMLETLIRNFPLRGKNSSLSTGEWYSTIPQAHCSSFLDSEARGEEKQGQDVNKDKTERAKGTQLLYLRGTNHQNSC